MIAFIFLTHQLFTHRFPSVTTWMWMWIFLWDLHLIINIGTMECLVDEGKAVAFFRPFMRVAERGCLQVV
jgi:hypothetical protein